MNLLQLMAWFNQRQAKKLTRHGHKTGWQYMTVHQCVRRLSQEMKELRSELRREKTNYQAIIDECADISNFAMFAANAARQKNLSFHR